MRALVLLPIFTGYGAAFTNPIKVRCKLPSVDRSVSLGTIKNDNSSRAEFLSTTLASLFAAVITSFVEVKPANAFDGGVGGLGKTRPVTGVVFRDPDASTGGGGTSNNGDDVTNELLAPDGTAAFVTFTAPWVSWERMHHINYTHLTAST